MGLNTRIPYCQATWEVIEGCSPVSAGCFNCWAKRLAARLGVEWGKAVFREDRLTQPLHWRKPRVIFVCSRSDLFHEEISLDFIRRVMGYAWNASQHTFLFLTKRPAQMLRAATMLGGDWPGEAPNLWFGVSIEDQATAEERIPILLRSPAAHRWVSVEPALGRAYVANWPGKGKVDCVVWGCESGSKRRPAPWAWEDQVRTDCEHHGVPYYCKQRSENPDGTGKVIHYPPRKGNWRG